MKVSRSQLRKIILREVKSLLEATSRPYNAGSGHGTYTFSYEDIGDEITVRSIIHNDGKQEKPISKEFFGSQAGMITDSTGLKIAKKQFQNDNRSAKISYNI